MNINKAAAALGSIGGKKGFGASKRRSVDHYRRIGLLSWAGKRRTIEDRFWEKVDKKGPDECWNWIGKKQVFGYGYLNIEKKPRLAHRISYELAYKVKIKDCVLHKCDNPACVNPNHLFEGSRSDNVKDMDKKGRRVMPKGEDVKLHKLTESDVAKIREDPRVNRIIGYDYGVTDSVISRAKNKRTWKHIP